MKNERKKEIKDMSLVKLNSIKKNLKMQLFKAKYEARGSSFSPPIGTATKLVSSLKKEIAIINTFIKQK